MIATVPASEQSRVLGLAAAVALCFILSVYSLVVKASSREGGGYAYDSKVVVLLAECLKLLICVPSLVLQVQRASATDELGRPVPLPDRVNFSPRVFCFFGVPGFIYFVNNNIPFLILAVMQAGSFKVLEQLKVLTTAFASRVIMKRKLSVRQLLSLGLLFLGCVVSQYNPERTLAVPVVGYGLVFLQCSLSAIAAVYTEKLLKDTEQSLALQNAQLYAFGIVFSLVGIISAGPAGGPQHWLDGFSIWTWSAVLTLGLGGWATSVVMKFADNIIKTYAIASSMFVVAVFSHMVFDEALTVELVCGAGLAIAALYLFMIMTEKQWEQALSSNRLVGILLACILVSLVLAALIAADPSREVRILERVEGVR